MPRHEGWRVLLGDTDRQDLLDYGKKLLGYLAEQRRLSGVKTMQIIRQTPDGSMVRARFAYDIPIIEVIAAEKAPPDVPTELNATGFVVTATTAELPSGIDATYPQQILKPSWTTFFKSKLIGGFNTFLGKKGTYGARFSNGVKYAGNIDWCDANGLRINYYGPTLRYWYDLYRKPTAQYGRWVFLNGAILLDIDDYCTSSGVNFEERLVVGAALVDDRLFVMQADINDFAPLNLAADYPDNRKTWVSAPYPPGNTVLRLVCYRVEKNPIATGSGDRYRVVPGSGDTFWTHTGRGWVNPFVFNPDATVCESFSMPDELRWTVFNDLDLGTTTENLPSTSNEHLTLSIGVSSATASFQTMTESASDWSFTGVPIAGEPAAVIAADYAADGTRIEVKIARYVRGTRAVTGSPWETVGIKFDDGNPVDLLGDTAVTAQVGFYNARPACIDARKKLFLVKSYAARLDPPATPFNLYTDVRLRLFTDGALTCEAEIPSVDDGTAAFFLSASYPYYPCGYILDNEYDIGLPTTGSAITDVSPMFIAHGIIVTGSYLTGVGPGFGGRSQFSWRPCSQHPEVFSTNEVVGYSGGFVGYTASNTHSTPGVGDGVFRTLAVSYGNGVQDTLGRRTPNSMAMDDDLNFMCSVACHIVTLSTLGFNGKTAMVDMTYRPAGAPTLQVLTGVSGNTTPYTISSPNTNYSARYSPIWLIGKPPAI